jgi:ABC-type multidrug transport system fused ATPase/permease subunit
MDGTVEFEDVTFAYPSRPGALCHAACKHRPFGPAHPPGTMQQRRPATTKPQTNCLRPPFLPADIKVFRNFNLTVPCGKTVALVGESGSGKSTVVGLIERFYDPLEGRVMIDGVDIRRLQVRLRSAVGGRERSSLWPLAPTGSCLSLPPGRRSSPSK